MLKRLLLTLSLVLSGFFFFSTPAFASGGTNIEISPVSNYFTIKAGDVQIYTFTVSNKGSSAFRYRLYTAPYIVTDEDYNLTFDEEKSSSYNQITRWVKFKDETGSFVHEPTFSIEPGEDQITTYRVKVPEDIPDGGQYGIIFAETVNDSTDQAGINAVSRVALTLVGHGVGSTKNTAEILEYYVTHPFSREGLGAGARVKNTGNTDFEATYHFVVKSLFGKTLYDETSSYTVLPETERRFKTAWDNAPVFGVFQVQFSLTAADSFREETHLVFIVPIFVVVIALLLLTLIVIWIIILVRKRKERSSRLVV